MVFLLKRKRRRRRVKQLKSRNYYTGSLYTEELHLSLCHVNAGNKINKLDGPVTRRKWEEKNKVVNFYCSCCTSIEPIFFYPHHSSAEGRKRRLLLQHNPLLHFIDKLPKIPIAHTHTPLNYNRKK